MVKEPPVRKVRTGHNGEFLLFLVVYAVMPGYIGFYLGFGTGITGINPE